MPPEKDFIKAQILQKRKAALEQKINAPVAISDVVIIPNEVSNEFELSNLYDSAYSSLERIIDHIKLLGTIAGEHHLLQNCCIDIEGDYHLLNKNQITRLLMQEFSFYTEKKPLSLSELHTIINWLSSYAKTKMQNLHLMLSSFAVELQDNQIINVVLYVQCGESAQVNVVLKKLPSDVDYNYEGVKYRSYSEKDGDLPAVVQLPMPDIDSNDQVRLSLDYSAVFVCTTAGGAQYFTAIDICLDHLNREAQKGWLAEIKKRMQNAPDEIIPLHVSHIISSSSVSLKKANFIVEPVQADSKIGYQRTRQAKVRGIDESSSIIVKLQAKYPLLWVKNVINETTLVGAPPFGFAFQVYLYEPHALTPTILANISNIIKHNYLAVYRYDKRILSNDWLNQRLEDFFQNLITFTPQVLINLEPENYRDKKIFFEKIVGDTRKLIDFLDILGDKEKHIEIIISDFLNQLSKDELSPLLQLIAFSLLRKFSLPIPNKHLPLVEFKVYLGTLLLSFDIKRVARIVNDNYGNTLLHLAILNKDATLVSWLINTIVMPINEYNDHRMSALRMALCLGDKKIFLAIMNSAQFSWLYTENKSLLRLIFIPDADPELIKLMLIKMPSLLSYQNEHGETLLHSMVTKKNIPMINVLLELMTDMQVRQVSSYGDSALIYAMRDFGGNGEIIKLLIEHSKVAYAEDLKSRPFELYYIYASTNDARMMLEFLTFVSSIKGFNLCYINVNAMFFGKSPLYVAIEEECTLEELQPLLNHPKITIGIKRDNFFSASIYSVVIESSNWKMLEVLLTHPRNVEVNKCEAMAIIRGLELRDDIKIKDKSIILLVLAEKCPMFMRMIIFKLLPEKLIISIPQLKRLLSSYHKYLAMNFKDCRFFDASQEQLCIKHELECVSATLTAVRQAQKEESPIKSISLPKCYLAKDRNGVVSQLVKLAGLEIDLISNIKTVTELKVATSAKSSMETSRKFQ